MTQSDRLRELYEQSGITYTELANQSGISVATVSRIINGGTGNTDSIDRILAVLERMVPAQSSEDVEISPHCKRCRAESIRHSEALREAFERHTAMMQTNFDQRIAETKRRATIYGIIALALAAVMIGMFVIDWTNGSVGWHRFMTGSYADPGIIRMIADWLHLL